MARNQVHKAHALVRQYCGQIGMPYHETSLPRSYQELLGSLHEVGEPLRRQAPLAAE